MDDEAKNLGIAAAELQPARRVTFCLLHIYACFYSVPNYRSARVCLISFFITGQTDRRHVSSPPSFGVHDFREMSKYFGMALGGVLHRLCMCIAYSVFSSHEASRGDPAGKIFALQNRKDESAYACAPSQRQNVTRKFNIYYFCSRDNHNDTSFFYVTSLSSHNLQSHF